ncbi:MAG: kynurenine formamidase [Gemmatimonadales bacterium]|nr:kynurenine formamidase [Gemmatimonadales bacterium]
MIYDISPPISPSLAVWPGDTPPSREVLLDLARGDSVTLSTLRATVHLGSHVDAPSHYGRDGRTIEAQPVERYIGPCEVMRVPVARGATVTPGLLPRPPREPRLLLSTGTYPDTERFNEDFAALSAELIDQLHTAGVRLIGVDTPSVDLFSSKELPAHGRCLAHDMAILEGLVLDAVPEGRYELIALPLKLVGFDASPVRAVLRSLR